MKRKELNISFLHFDKIAFNFPFDDRFFVVCLFEILWLIFVLVCPVLDKEEQNRGTEKAGFQHDMCLCREHRREGGRAVKYITSVLNL